MAATVIQSYCRSAIPVYKLFSSSSTTPTTRRRRRRKKLFLSSQQSHKTSSSLPLWTAPEIAEAVNGKIVKWGPPGTISTDTRTLTSTTTNPTWFFAITGSKFDGHDFITPELGCVGVIGHRVCNSWNNKGFVKLDENDCNSVFALKKLANYARRRFGSEGNVVGVTGSVGKTTTRRMIAMAVSSVFRVHETCENYNNFIGVGLTLIGIPRNAEVVVVEIGMSRKGEILELARMCRPNVRVVLNVGCSHLESLGSLEGVAEAKGEILMEAREGDVCVLNGDDPLVMGLHVPQGVKKVLFGRSMGCDIRLVHAESTNRGRGVLVVLQTKTEMVEFVIPTPGLHLALNACAAAAVAVLLGVSLSKVGLSLSRYIPVHMRSELEIAENGILIINDVYNANPTSTKAAIDLLKNIDSNGKRVAILGDMLELGLMETTAHETVLRLCFDARISLVALVGKRYLAAAKALDIFGMINVICESDAEALALKITDNLSRDDIVLVKGSRGMQMEKVVNAIKAVH